MGLLGSWQTLPYPYLLTPNIVGCHMLRPFTHPVACCCTNFESGQTFEPTTPSISFVLRSRNIAQQYWIRSHSSSLARPTLLGLYAPELHKVSTEIATQTRWQPNIASLQSLMHGSYHSHNTLHVLTFLGAGPFEHNCQHHPTSAEPATPNNVASLCTGRA